MATYFDNHEIVSRVEADQLGSWLIKRRHEDGGWDSTFWARITAADGRLTVVGDFEPTVFAHGPLDPVACLRWIGSRGDVDTYKTEKASIGTGYSRIWLFDPAIAKQELQEMLADPNIDDYGDNHRRALQAGFDVAKRLPRATKGDYFGGLLGIEKIINAVTTVDRDMIEVVCDIGRTPRPSVELAVQAAHRLTQLLEAEAVPS